MATGMSRARRVVAFTLIELLVVVSIIALLLAILLPSLSRARDQARGTVCAGRMRECTQATIMMLLESHQSTTSSNFGWGVQTFRVLQGVREAFLCPTDAAPDPIPAFLDRQHDNTRLRAVVSPDSPFSTYEKLSSTRWKLNIQDQIDSNNLGGDLDNDLVFEYDAPPGASMTTVKLTDASVAWSHTITDYRGRPLTSASSGATFDVPLLWGSFAMNASAGLRNQRSTGLLLLVEYNNPYRKWSAVPERFGDWPSDNNLNKRVQLRHGGGKLANVSFLDGHVERLGQQKLWVRTSSVWQPAYRPPGWKPSF